MICLENISLEHPRWRMNWVNFLFTLEFQIFTGQNVIFEKLSLSISKQGPRLAKISQDQPRSAHINLDGEDWSNPI